MLEKVFNADNPFWNGMSKLFDLFVLNNLWLLCCLPIITIGPSTAAFYYCQINLARGEEGYIIKDFFRSFRQNLKQGICLGLPMTLAGAFLAFDIYICRQSGTGIYTFFMVFFAVLFLLWAFVALYSFAILAKFEQKNGEIILLAFTSSLKNIPLSLVMIAAIIFAMWCIHIIPGLLFIMFGLTGDAHGALFAHIFKKKLPPAGIIEDIPLSCEDASEQPTH